MIEMQVRPIGIWPGGARTPAAQRKRAPFTHMGGESYTRRPVPVLQTLAELKGELQAIGCTQAVIEAGFRDWDIGRDGWPLARARTPEDPGVVLRILKSKHGELAYPCDTFTTWEGNLRAIMLALEALRKVDRYGVTKRGEQYSGWKALPSQGTSTLTAEAAAGVIVAHSNGALDSKEAKKVVAKVLKDQTAARDALRNARKATHPDTATGTQIERDGRTSQFQIVESAASVLAQHFGVERL